MSFLFENNAASVLVGQVLVGATTLSVTATEGALFPNPSGGDTFRCTLTDASNNIEVIECSARTNDAFTTITRGLEGTTARQWEVGDVIELRVTKGVLDGFSQKTNTVLLDTAAVRTGGNITMQDNLAFKFGTGEDSSLYGGNDNNLYIDVNALSDIVFRENTTQRFLFDMSTGGLTASSLALSGAITGATNVTLTGVLDVSGLFKMQGGYSEDMNQTAGSGVVNLNADVASYFLTTFTGAVTYTFSTTVPSARVTSMTLEMIGAATFGVAFPASIEWPDGIVPIWTTGRDIVTIMTRDGGTTWFGFAGGLAMA